MFTSRAEYRLRLRADNADQRLTPKALELGCASRQRETAFKAKTGALESARSLVRSLRATPDQLAKAGFQINQDGVRRSAFDLLRYPDIALPQLASYWPELTQIAPEVAEQVEIEARYMGYLDRQDADVRAFRRDEALILPDNLDYGAIHGLSNEVREKLLAARPATLGAAGRIPGMTPAALVALLRHVKRKQVAAAVA